MKIRPTDEELETLIKTADQITEFEHTTAKVSLELGLLSQLKRIAEALLEERRYHHAITETWETPFGDTFEVQGDFITHLDCGFVWGKLHRALAPEFEECPNCPIVLRVAQKDPHLNEHHEVLDA